MSISESESRHMDKQHTGGGGADVGDYRDEFEHAASCMVAEAHAADVLVELTPGSPRAKQHAPMHMHFDDEDEDEDDEDDFWNWDAGGATGDEDGADEGGDAEDQDGAYAYNEHSVLSVASGRVRAPKAILRIVGRGKKSRPRDMRPRELRERLARVVLSQPAGTTTTSAEARVDPADVSVGGTDCNESNIWIDVEGASSEVLDVIGDKFQLHPLTTEDCTHFDDGRPSGFMLPISLEREKLEVFPLLRYAFVQYHAVGEEYSLDRMVPVKLLVYENCLVTLRHRPVHELTRVYNNTESSIRSISQLVYSIIKELNRPMFAFVERTSGEVENLASLVDILSSLEQRDLMKRVSGARQNLVRLKHVLAPKLTVLSRMVSTPGSKQFFSTVHHFHDVLDHLSVMQMRVDLTSDMLNSLEATYLARASLDIASASHETTEVMKTLTVVATLILPLTLLTSLWGMNVRLPGYYSGEDSDDPHYAAFTIISVVVLVSLYAGITFFRKRRLL